MSIQRTRSLSDIRLIDFGKAGFGQIFQSFSLNSYGSTLRYATPIAFGSSLNRIEKSASNWLSLTSESPKSDSLLGDRHPYDVERTFLGFRAQEASENCCSVLKRNNKRAFNPSAYKKRNHKSRPTNPRPIIELILNRKISADHCTAIVQDSVPFSPLWPIDVGSAPWCLL